MPAEPVTVTERSLIPREILTTLAALCFICTVACVIVAGIGYERGTLKNQFVNPGSRYTQDYSRFVLAVGPWIPFIMLFAGAWNAKRIALFALGVFVAWAGMAIDMAKRVDFDRRNRFDGVHKGSKMLESGLVIMIFFCLLSLLSISPRDTTRWWSRSRRTVTTPGTQVGTLSQTPGMVAPAPTTTYTTGRRSHGPLFIFHYILTSFAWLVTLAGCAVLFQTIRKYYLNFPTSEAAVVLNYLYFILIVMAFFATSTALLCDSDLYAGFSLALNALTAIFTLRFAVDIDNLGFQHHMQRLLIAGLSLLFAGSVISAAGVMSRRSNLHVHNDATTAPNPALP